MLSSTSLQRRWHDNGQFAVINRRFWNTSPIMTLFLYASLVFIAVGVGGLIFDDRQILNQPAWAKTTKFALSFTLYAPTMLWMFSYVTIRPRLKRFVLDACGTLLFSEMILVIIQAVRGETMHFNISTPFNALLWTIMSVTIMLFYVVSIIGFVVFLRQKPLVDRAFLLSLRLGMALMLIGFGLGFLMTGPNNDQLAVLQSGGTLAAMGAHTVGAVDGGSGITLLGWSTTHGDLRIAHFVGIHGAQVMALLGWLLLVGAERRWTFLRLQHRTALVWGAAVAYLAFVGSIAWQALRGQPLLKPDALTIGVWLGIVAGAGLYSAAVVWRARTGKKTGTLSLGL